MQALFNYAFETGSSVSQADLRGRCVAGNDFELLILQFPFPKCWDCGCIPAHPAFLVLWREGIGHDGSVPVELVAHMLSSPPLFSSKSQGNL